MKKKIISFCINFVSINYCKLMTQQKFKDYTIVTNDVQIIIIILKLLSTYSKYSPYCLIIK